MKDVSNPTPFGVQFCLALSTESDTGTAVYKPVSGGGIAYTRLKKWVDIPIS